MKKVWVLQHIACETLGTIATALEGAGLTPQYIRTHEGERAPKSMEDAAALVVMGGPMGVYDYPQYPFLRGEMRLIESALAAEKPILGVCLGSQLLAAALGARVEPGKQKEIGWHPVMLSDEAKTDPLWSGVEPTLTPFHWHGDIFDMPRGATLLASSALTTHQSFRYGKSAYGILFHMEVTEPMVREMVHTFADELHAASINGQEIIAQTPTHLARIETIGQRVFRRWAALVN